MESSCLLPVAVASRGRTFSEARLCHFAICAWQVRLSESAHADVESAELCAAFVAKCDALAGRRDLSFDAAVRAMGGPKSATTATGCKARLVVRLFASGGVAVTSVENAHSGHALGGGYRKAAALSRDDLDDLADQVSNREASAATVARAQERLRPGTSVNVNALKSAISRAVRRRRDEQSNGIAAGAGVTDQESQDFLDAFSGCDNYGLFKFGFPRNPSVSSRTETPPPKRPRRSAGITAKTDHVLVTLAKLPGRSCLYRVPDGFLAKEWGRAGEDKQDPLVSTAPTTPPPHTHAALTHQHATMHRHMPTGQRQIVLRRYSARSSFVLGSCGLAEV